MGWYKRAQTSKEIAGDNYGYWIGPDGQIHDVIEEAGHVNSLYDLKVHESMENYSNWLNNPNEKGIYDHAFQQGYVKITLPLEYTRDKVFFVDFRRKLSQPQIAAITRLIQNCYSKYQGNCYFQICKGEGMKKMQDPKEAILALY